MVLVLVVVELNDGECVREEDDEMECSGGDLDISSPGDSLELLDRFAWVFVFAMGDRGEFECGTSGGKDSWGMVPGMSKSSSKHSSSTGFVSL